MFQDGTSTWPACNDHVKGVSQCNCSVINHPSQCTLSSEVGSQGLVRDGC
jgi:hypothetical protein